MAKYGISKTIPLPFDQAIERVTAALKREGFGVLTTIDVKDTLKRKLDVEFKRYVILGACNPALAHEALQAEAMIGLLLPCNVIVYEEGQNTVIAAFDPMSMTALVPDIEPVAREVRARLERVIQSM
jgi:uncharacterized protein (DUF302 family)